MAERQKNVCMNAGILKRTAAFLLDIILLNIVILAPFKGVVKGLLPAQDFESIIAMLESNDYVFSTLYAISIFVGLIIFAYFVLLEWKTGQTMGKMVFGIYVMPAARQKDGRLECRQKERMGFIQSVASNMLFIPFFPFFLMAAIDPVFMLFSRENQRLSEKIASVKTVEMQKI